MTRTTSILVLIGLALFLAACQEPLPAFTYEGTSTIEGVDHPLILVYEQRGDVLSGEYQVGVVKGTFHGSLDGNAVAADLTPGVACTYSFEGTLSGIALIGEFEPTGCEGGQGGTWTLELR